MKTPNLPSQPDGLAQINPDGKPLTPELLKTFPGCENYSESQALDIIRSLEKLAAVCYIIANNEKIYSIDNQHIVYLKTKNIAA